MSNQPGLQITAGQRKMSGLIVATLKRAKTAERNSTTCECIFHQLAVKNVNVNVVITIYCQHNWIFLRQKKIISIHYLTGQNRGLSGLNCLTIDYPLINDNDQWLIILNDAIKHQLAISSIYHYQISSYLQEKIFKLATLIGPDIPWPKNWNYLTAKYFL